MTYNFNKGGSKWSPFFYEVKQGGKMKSFLYGIFFLICVSSGAQAESVKCDFGSVKFLSNFETARLNGCEVKSGDYYLYISPEITPVNPSPWYAFKVVSDKERTINVYLNYTYAKHRYWPKISRDGLRWSRLKPGKIKEYKKGRKVRLRLNVGRDPLWVSAQEILNGQYYDVWNRHMESRNFVSLSKMGNSVEGRPIYKLETAGDWGEDKPGNLMLIGRQHPPEVTGALAMIPFVETLLADTPLAKKFRNKFRIIIVPNLNPDGVAQGNWRTNANGKDLNRDWRDFSQPETRLIKTELNRFKDEKEGRLHLFLDFHSTWENLIYTQTREDKTTPPAFASRWYEAIKKRAPKIPFKHDPRHNSTLPTSKGYVFNHFGAPAITYEMGDEADREQIFELAMIAAEEMMKILLDS